jgi:hypothetical protein
MAHIDQRPDAASFVTVNATNVNVYGMSASAMVDPSGSPKFGLVFAPLNGTNTKWEKIIEYFPYEYGSLMHNSQYRYSVGDDPTITLVAANTFEPLLGNRGYITEQDARVLNEMYMCDRLPVMLADRKFASPLVQGETYEVRYMLPPRFSIPLRP